jgi:hypothetical protein
LRVMSFVPSADQLINDNRPQYADTTDSQSDQTKIQSVGVFRVASVPFFLTIH